MSLLSNKVLILLPGDKSVVLDVWFFLLLHFIIVFIIVFVIVYLIQRKRKTNFKKDELDNTEITYFRDIPFDNLEVAFWVGTYYGIIENMSDFIGAMLLKWIKENKLDIIEDSEKTIIDMRNVFKTDLGFESDIYIKLLACAGKNRLLEEKEFKSFFQDNEKVLMTLFKKMKKEAEDKLKEQNLITVTLTEFGHERITVSEELKQKAEQLQGLKNFLLNFSNIENKDSIQVHIWDDYLIYAELLGIADKVETELEKVYPDYNKTVKLNMAKIALAQSLTTSLEITADLFIRMLIGSSKDYR